MKDLYIHSEDLVQPFATLYVLKKDRTQLTVVSLFRCLQVASYLAEISCDQEKRCLKYNYKETFCSVLPADLLISCDLRCWAGKVLHNQTS